MTDKQKQKRILKLADYVESLPRERFNFRHWVGSGWQGKVDLSCGTTACALGWATAMPMFRRLGLRMGQSELVGGAPEVFGSNSIVRLAELFGVTTSVFDRLFHPDSRPGYLPGRVTNKQWAKHARSIYAELQ
jgi:hypothetical protein